VLGELTRRRHDCVLTHDRAENLLSWYGPLRRTRERAQTSRPFEGEQGRTSYANGIVRIELAGAAIVVRPPFGLAHEAQYETVRLAPLFAAIADDHIVAALLVRLGGYAVGVFDGDASSPRRSARALSRTATRRAAHRPTASAGAARSRRGR